MFDPDQRTDTEKEIYAYVSKLTKWRQSATAIHYGKTIHFLPEDNVYIYFRYDEKQKIMVIMNMNEQTKIVSRKKHLELLRGSTTGTNILTGQSIDVTNDFEVAGKTTTILELK